MQPANSDSADRMGHSITTLCVCGGAFKPDSEEDSYCSVQCARLDALKALSRGELDHTRTDSPTAMPAELPSSHAVNAPAIERRHGAVPGDGRGASETGLGPTSTPSMSQLSPNTAISAPNRPRQLRRMRSSRELGRLAKSHGDALSPSSLSQSLPSDPIGPPDPGDLADSRSLQA